MVALSSLDAPTEERSHHRDTEGTEGRWSDHGLGQAPKQVASIARSAPHHPRTGGRTSPCPLSLCGGSSSFWRTGRTPSLLRIDLEQARATLAAADAHGDDAPLGSAALA